MFLKPVTILFVIGAVFAISTATPVSTDQQDCPKICNLNYEPLCATNGKVYKEFGNACDLKASNCRLERTGLHSEYIPIAMDWCKTELIGGLQQLMEKMGISDFDKPDCMKPCPLIYSPVCVSNGQYRAVISNECLVKAVNCVLSKEPQAAFSVLKYGSC